MELRHFVREVYHIILETPRDDVMPIVDSSQDEHMKAIAKRYKLDKALIFMFVGPILLFLSYVSFLISGSLSLIHINFTIGCNHKYMRLQVLLKQDLKRFLKTIIKTLSLLLSSSMV